GSADSIITSGKSIGILTGIANTYIDASGKALKGTALQNALVADLQKVKNNYQQALTDFETAQTEFTNQKAVVDGIQANYTAKQEEVTTAYNALQDASKELNNKTAIYDFAQMVAYSQHQSPEGLETTSIRSPTEIVKQRLDAANTEVTNKLKEIESIQARIAKQTTVASLNADPKVAENKQATEDWAERALRFSQAETK
ncbi:hypothetical protein CH373_18545, partial [Leptospira perolatii]